MTSIPPKFKQKQAVATNGQTKNTLTLIVIGIAFLGFLLAAYKGKDFLTVDKEGAVVLSPERLDKLQQELEDLDEAEQYALKAISTGYFPCLNCKDSTVVYLRVNDVWKYGATSKGEGKRYRNALAKDNLYYNIQFEGNYVECLKLEKTKIYNYALLPENLMRKKPLIRPPGNKIDR